MICLQRLLHVVASAQQPAAAEQQLTAGGCSQWLTQAVDTLQLPAAGEQELAAAECL